MHRAALFLVYFLLVTPAGLVSRVVRDPMRRRLDPSAASYWINTGRQVGATGSAPTDTFKGIDKRSSTECGASPKPGSGGPTRSTCAW